MVQGDVVLVGAHEQVDGTVVGSHAVDVMHYFRLRMPATEISKWATESLFGDQHMLVASCVRRDTDGDVAVAAE
ncbi:hypothetical protein WJ59_17340 [Burkholderia gladioli]|nr:hypothetical protein WJ59_17340 [Burkholderia gladioli]